MPFGPAAAGTANTLSPLGRPGQLAATVLAAPERLAARQPRSAKAKATQHRRRGRGWGRRGRGRMRRSGAFRSDGTSAFRLTRPLDQLFRPFDPDQGSPTLNRVCTDFPDPLVTRGRHTGCAPAGQKTSSGGRSRSFDLWVNPPHSGYGPSTLSTAPHRCFSSSQLRESVYHISINSYGTSRPCGHPSRHPGRIGSTSREHQGPTRKS